MVDREKIQKLKAILRREVAYMCRNRPALWTAPIGKTLQELREMEVHAAFFGGTLRSLLLSRLYAGRPGRPRDIDIVVGGDKYNIIQAKFISHLQRYTRFGGMKLRRGSWDFDLWPIHKTWAFEKNRIPEASFEDLPNTTFLNLEAIAVDIWPPRGKARKIYSADDRFFHGVLNRTIEINCEDNPFPELNAVRALLLAESTRFTVGPKLVQYLAQFAKTVSTNQWEQLQQSHYGIVKKKGVEVQQWVRRCDRHLQKHGIAPYHGHSRPHYGEDEEVQLHVLQQIREINEVLEEEWLFYKPVHR